MMFVLMQFRAIGDVEVVQRMDRQSCDLNDAQPYNQQHAGACAKRSREKGKGLFQSCSTSDART